MTLRVSRASGSIILTLPPRCSDADAGTFVSRHMAWLRDNLELLPAPVPFGDGASMPLRGEMHRLVFTGPGRASRVVMQRAAPDSTRELLVSGHLEHAPRRLRDWLWAQARADLESRVAHHARNLGLTYKRISIRDQSSRWGSCSTTGVLSFSWRLVMAPPLVLDYVAAHEVAHLAEMNHGRRFWALVRKTMPEMDEAKAWLHASGMELHRYGVAA